MSEAKTDNLPQDVKDSLTEGAQQIFSAAFNSAKADGLDDQHASQVAWNTIKGDYEQGEDGKWHRKPEGGAGGHGALGTMPGS